MHINLIPKANNTIEKEGRFVFDKSCCVRFEKEFTTATEAFKKMISSSTLFKMKEDENNASITFAKDTSLPEEGYRLLIDKKGVQVFSATDCGAFYAVQTMRQLSQADLIKKSDKLIFPCVEINDSPRISWRGLLLDESRHFFGKDEVKRFLDLMAMLKLNVLHWHLTDDQGWRVEIKKYPRLTEIGSKRNESNIHGWQSCDSDHTPHEGFYTQEDIKEIVQYAADRHISVYPEIDMPAHFAAAMASYNWLGCREKECEVMWYFGGKVPTSQGIKDWNRSACAGKETTYEFIFNVIDELVELFPFPYFHIGGDEAPKDEWKNCPHCQKVMKENKLSNETELQGYFTNRIYEYLKTKGRTLIGWNEILSSKILDKNIVGQYWTPVRDANAIRYINNGGRLLLSKHQAFYFDMGYAQYPLKNTYSFDPMMKGFAADAEKRILGIEGAVWTEWVEGREKLDMITHPRMEALSEVAWTKKENKNWDDFLRRWQLFKSNLDVFDVNYAEDEISMPKGFIKRKKEVMHWYKIDPNHELELNKAVKGKHKK